MTQVVQAVLRMVPISQIRFTSALVTNIKTIITAKFGCKVVNEAVDVLDMADITLIVDLMAKNASEMVNDVHAVSFSFFAPCLSASTTSKNMIIDWKVLTRCRTMFGNTSSAMEHLNNAVGSCLASSEILLPIPPSTSHRGAARMH